MPGYTAAQRLDRLPIGAFHRRILFMIGAGMFLAYFDAMLQGSVLASLAASHWSTLNSNGQFISTTFLGMLIGSFLAGVLADRYGRRFTWQVNLLIIGVTSLGAALAPSMRWLIGIRLIMGLGLGAELAIGYSTMSEFVPPSAPWPLDRPAHADNQCRCCRFGVGRLLRDPRARLASAVRGGGSGRTGGMENAHQHARIASLAGS